MLNFEYNAKPRKLLQPCNTLNDSGEEHLFRKFVTRTNLGLKYIKFLHITTYLMTCQNLAFWSNLLHCVVEFSSIFCRSLGLSHNERRLWGEVLSIFKVALFERTSYPFSCHDKKSFMQHKIHNSKLPYPTFKSWVGKVLTWLTSYLVLTYTVLHIFAQFVLFMK